MFDEKGARVGIIEYNQRDDYENALRELNGLRLHGKVVSLYRDNSQSPSRSFSRSPSRSYSPYGLSVTFISLFFMSLFFVVCVCVCKGNTN